MVVAVIGNIDHGKSTLLGRLLFDSQQIKAEKIKEVKKIAKGSQLDYAFFLDHFREERLKGMTIDVAYAHYRSPKFEYIFVDTPGHHQFIKNMLSGTSNAQAALLLVSVALKEGIQEQTIRHLKLAKLLGINQLVVAVNKMDLVSYDEKIFRKIVRQTAALLKSIGFSQRTPFVPISALNGVNVYRQSRKTPWYSGKSLIKQLDSHFKLPPNLNKLPLRFVIQDIFSLGEEQVIAGKIESGVLRVGQKIIFQPGHFEVKVKEIRAVEAQKAKAGSGEMVGLIVAGRNNGLSRGQVAGLKFHSPTVKKKFTAQIYLIKKKKINSQEIFLLRCGLSEVNCQLKKIYQEKDGFAKVQITTSKPIVIEKFAGFPSLGRLILVQKEQNIAVGIRMN